MDPRALARPRSSSNPILLAASVWLFWLVSALTHARAHSRTRSSVFQWQLVCDSAWKVHIAKFSLLVGSIFGYLVMGVTADW